MAEQRRQSATRRRRPAAGTSPAKRKPAARPTPSRKRGRSYRLASEQATPVKVQPKLQRSGGKRLSMPRLPVGRLVAFGLAVGLVALLVFVFADDRFYVQAADISGLTYGSQAEVYQRAGVDGYSVFWVNGREAAERIETLSYVKAATVRSALPDKVRIEVEERQPVALWKVNGHPYWVDAEGVTMTVTSLIEGLPVLSDLDSTSITAPGRVDVQLVTAVQELKKQMPQVGEFAYNKINGLQFRIPGSTVVYLGKPEGLDRRVKELLALQSSLAASGDMPAEINWRNEGGYFLRMAQ